jgi:predicted lipoprotein
MRAARWLIAVAIAMAICWRFPLFHVVALKTAAAEKTAATFDPTEYAEAFWTNQLVPSLTKAVKAETLLPAIQTDATMAKTHYSRSVGMSESYFYFLSGTGRVMAVSDDEVSLAINNSSTNAEISLQTGLVFGNALRDGTGLLNVNDYPNSQDFNGISEALNHIVETRVLPKLHDQAKVGTKIYFVGCAEVDDESSDLKPLKVIPIKTENK